MKTYTTPALPGKTFRRLEVGERVQNGDWTNAKSNDQESGWVEAGSHAGREVQSSDWLFYYREVSETNDSTTMKNKDSFTLWGVQDNETGRIVETRDSRQDARKLIWHEPLGFNGRVVKLECRIVKQRPKKRKTFVAHGMEWIPHTPGDPMPCEGEKEVRALCAGEWTATGEARHLKWCQNPYCDKNTEIIGWNFAP